MRKSFEEVLDRIILEKKKKGLKYDDIVEGAKVSKPTLACLLNPKKRGVMKVDTILKVMDYIENVEVK